MNQLQTTFVDIQVAASTMRTYSARPPTDQKLPLVIVFQEAFGVNAHIQDVANRIGSLGYHALAPELFHRAVPAGFTAAYNDFPSIVPIFKTINEATLSEDALATYNWAAKQTNIDIDKCAAIGFCLGGRATFIANAVLPLRAALAYYGGGIADLLHLVPNQYGPIHFFWGALDKHITAEHRIAIHAAMTKSDKSFSEHVYGTADHAFFCDDRPAYHSAAAHSAWGISKAILEDALSQA